jgi:uncharacterized damage-inducible protein DinB
MTLNEISTLLEYDNWATGRTLEAVSSVSTDKYLEDLKSSHGGIHTTLVHIYSADMVWFRRWTGSPAAAHIGRSEIPDLPSLKGRWESYQNDIASFLRTLDDSKLKEPLPYKDMKGNPHSEPLFQQMQHLVNHASYHRGQVVTMLRQIGATPVGTDLITFYRSKVESS